MKLLANENFPLLAVEALCAAGHDVLWVRTDMPGKTDDVILQRAQDEGRLVLTFDKDFGELACRYGLPANCGVILFRLHTQSPVHMRDRVLDALAQRQDWAGYLSVVDENRIRMRPLPG
jgi:predicted nuclease of predicted toxin-antitoxin system